MEGNMHGYRRMIGAVVALAVLPAAAGAQQMPRDPIAAANVTQSRRYETLLQTNPSFREKRIAEECGPVTDPQLHAQCVASFGPAPATPAPPQR
jgi:hypothetical protein